MKKRYIIIATILAVLLVGTGIGITYAKYVEELVNVDGRITNPKVYFYSDILKESQTSILDEGAEPPEMIEVFGDRATVRLYNSASSELVSNVDVDYTLTYYVEIDGVWMQQNQTTGKLKASEGMHYHEIVVAPIGEYDDVIVEVVTASPYSRILSARLQFVEMPYSVSFGYDRDMGVIKMTVATNSDSGTFRIGWVEGVLPDNADPNGILTSGEVGADSVDAELEPFTTYDLYFFISADVRAELDAILDAAIADGTYEQALTELAEEAIQYEWVDQNP